MTARQLHHVSQCYLKGFVADRDNPKLFVVDAKEMRSFVTHPKNVAVERDFHTIDVDGVLPDAIEKDLSAFEGELDQALKRIVTARSIIDDNDRAILFNFICLLALKNPGLRENIRAAHEQAAKLFLDLATDTPEAWADLLKQTGKDGDPVGVVDDYELARDFVKRGAFKIETTTEFHLQMELGFFSKILPLIFRRKWMLFRAPIGSSGFVTSDHPVCLEWSDPKQRGGFWPPGLAVARTQLLFPIAKELAMIGAFEIEDGECDATELTLAQINGSIMVHAGRQIYSCDDTFQYRMQHNSRIMRGFELLEDQRVSRPPDFSKR